MIITQKNPRAHKNKIGTPPPKTQNTPPPKTRNFMGMGIFLQKGCIFPGAHKIAELRGKKFYGHEDL